MRYPCEIAYAKYHPTVSENGEKMAGYGTYSPVKASVYALTDTDKLAQYGLDASLTMRLYIRGQHPLQVRDRVQIRTTEGTGVWRVVEAVQYRQHKTAVIAYDDRV